MQNNMYYKIYGYRFNSEVVFQSLLAVFDKIEN